MSIGSALQTGVNGLRAQSTKLATISDNIANSSTVGYKRADTQFSTLVVNDGSSSSYTAGGVTTQVRQEISTQGTILASDNVTDLAIAGNGFFAVAAQENGSGSALTRAGSFRTDQFGNLQNAGGYFLQGFPLNPDGTYTNGAPNLTTFDSMETINLSTIQGTAVATSQIDYSGNLPAQTTDPTAEFRSSVQYFDEFGASRNIVMVWRPVTTDPLGTPADPTDDVVTDNQWTLSLYNDTYDATAPAVNLMGDITGIDFDAATPGTPTYGGSANLSGADPQLLAPTAAELAAGTVQLQVSGNQTIQLSLGAPDSLDGVTQFGGDFTPLTNVDGSPLGQLQSVDIDESGRVFAIFDNGQVRPIYQIPLVDVINPEGLTAIDGNAFQLSADSGEMRVAERAGVSNTGTISSGALEGANVDVAEELTTLIETQRAYSSNATVIQTADEMLEEVTRIGR